jgi:hypothetical protein
VVTAVVCCDALGHGFLALSGHANDAEQCPLSRAKRTWLKDGVMSAYDPKRTLEGLAGCKIVSLLLTDPRQFDILQPGPG